MLKMVKQLKILIVFFTLTLCFNAFAEKIKVVAEHLPPYQIANSTRLDGFAIDVTQALFSTQPQQPDIEIMPWARAYLTALHNKNTLILSIARMQSRETLFHWIGTLNTETLYVWSLASNTELTPYSLMQLKTAHIAVSQNSYVDQFLTQQLFTNLERLATPEQYIGMLFKSRVDYIISTEATLKKQLEQLNLDFKQLKKVLALTELQENLSIAINLNSNPELIRQFQTEFKQLEENGVLQQLRHKWQIDVDMSKKETSLNIM
ncbi:polar amino acid transport system substrate-binding protein [Pseudoalteromonas ulvae UL12]|uniref:substrate-binding periplasmic protein n=1 Tax=Pseudoalteromonas ulvae TaxID=107327 RepID=UPI00186B96AD|nr:transporter substrate-binding domain-containing protein [Pseudoalteromonas ulvae]MBE0362030.1 polar amino acid transport system substrate-binding protein [Pseudoalteromonas ulvae UL12]